MKPAWLLLAGLAAGGCAGHGNPAPLQPAVQGDSLLRPGDVLRITVWRQPECLRRRREFRGLTAGTWTTTG